MSAVAFIPALMQAGSRLLIGFVMSAGLPKESSGVARPTLPRWAMALFLCLAGLLAMPHGVLAGDQIGRATASNATYLYDAGNASTPVAQQSPTGIHAYDGPVTFRGERTGDDSGFLAANGGGAAFRALNEVPGGALQQIGDRACASACATMLSEGRLDQQAVFDTIGGDASTARLADVLGHGWRGGGLDMSKDEAFVVMSRNGPWAAWVRAAQTGYHAVVVDGVNDAGNVVIRDPWEGSAYETPFPEFMSAWPGQGVFRP